MPYIKSEDRKRIMRTEIGSFVPANAGELQYAIAEMIHGYHMNHGFNYQMSNNMMGALVGAQQEYYREVVAPYEEIKKRDNGPVYELHNYQSPLTTVKY